MADYVRVRVNPEAAGQAKAAVLKAVKDTFELDMVPKAKELSPVTEEGIVYNRDKHPHWPLTKVGGSGTNRRSIESEVLPVDRGVQGEMFTTSGYGGFLETGTRFMRAQPYIWPAFIMYVSLIPQRVKDIIGKRR
jgi:hypothetical protein